MSNKSTESKKGKPEEMKFEESFSRLEEILETMNSETVSLDNSLKLYEEADKLINSCSKRLNEAEQKVETLIKNRSGELAVDSEGTPLTEEYSPSTHNG